MLLFHKGPDRVDMLSCAVKSTCSSKSLDHNLLIACVLGYRSLQMCVWVCACFTAFPFARKGLKRVLITMCMVLCLLGSMPGVGNSSDGPKSMLYACFSHFHWKNFLRVLFVQRNPISNSCTPLS